MENAKITYSVALNYVLTNCDLPADIAEKLTALQTSVEKKSANKKPTSKQVENEGLKTSLVEFLRGKSLTVGEICKAEEFEGLSSQKISSLLTQLKESGAVERSEIKRVAYFTAK